DRQPGLLVEREVDISNAVRALHPAVRPRENENAVAGLVPGAQMPPAGAHRQPAAPLVARRRSGFEPQREHLSIRPGGDHPHALFAVVEVQLLANLLAIEERRAPAPDLPGDAPAALELPADQMPGIGALHGRL